MASFIRKGCKVYVGGYDKSDHCQGGTVEGGVESVDNTTLVDTTRKYTGGLYTGTIDLNMFDDYATNSVDQLFNPVDGVYGNPAGSNWPFPITVGVEPGIANAVFVYMMYGVVGDYKKTKTIGDMAKADLAFKCTTEIIRGQVLTGDRTISSSTNDTGVQLGALTANDKMFMFIHITGVSSPNGITVNLQSSTTQGGAYTTRASGSAISAIGFQIVTLNGPQTDTWWRAQWAWTSGTATVTVVAGKKTVIGV